MIILVTIQDVLDQNSNIERDIVRACSRWADTWESISWWRSSSCYKDTEGNNVLIPSITLRLASTDSLPALEEERGSLAGTNLQTLLRDIQTLDIKDVTVEVMEGSGFIFSPTEEVSGSVSGGVRSLASARNEDEEPSTKGVTSIPSKRWWQVWR